MGTAHAKRNEEGRFEKLVSAMKKDSFDPERWKRDYYKPVSKQFRRPEWEGQYFIARVKRAKQDDVPGKLREIMVEIDKKDDLDGNVEDLFEEAREDASEAFTEYYEDAQKVLYADVKANRAFPVDTELRKAFSKILDDLAKSNDGNVHIAFVNETQLATPEGDDKVLDEMRRGAPVKNPKVIKPGNAFSPAYDKKRRNTFMTAMNESFKQVFASEGLLNLVPLKKGASRNKKIVFEVSSKIFRVSSYFTYTQNNVFAGFLFAINVEWGFKIYDRAGNVLYAPDPQRSQPAQNIQVASGPNDPTWAPYSIIMDSAYYNYSREMTGKFGLTPPPEKTRFSYEGSATSP